MTGPYEELPLPRTELALEALRHAKRTEHPSIFNHSLRTYLHGRASGERRGLLPGRDYDDELLFLGCVLHDAGLTPQGDGDQSFDLDGADLAARFLTERGMPADRPDDLPQRLGPRGRGDGAHGGRGPDGGGDGAAGDPGAAVERVRALPGRRWSRGQ
ncbi:HD domain-containing protein [Streptomyces sp. KL2]|uniref:HD domain-containing protein n=1 Tax=Streptomyces sp. KL2 TaxID=3050126 RepID=UPI00397DF238